MKNLQMHLAHAAHGELKNEWRDVIYSLMVRREAMKSSHIRMVRKLRTASWH